MIRSDQMRSDASVGDGDARREIIEPDARS